MCHQSGLTGLRGPDHRRGLLRLGEDHRRCSPRRSRCSRPAAPAATRRSRSGSWSARSSGGSPGQTCGAVLPRGDRRAARRRLLHRAARDGARPVLATCRASGRPRTSRPRSPRPTPTPHPAALAALLQPVADRRRGQRAGVADGRDPGRQRARHRPGAWRRSSARSPTAPSALISREDAGRRPAPGKGRYTDLVLGFPLEFGLGFGLSGPERHFGPNPARSGTTASAAPRSAPTRRRASPSPT